LFTESLGAVEEDSHKPKCRSIRERLSRFVTAQYIREDKCGAGQVRGLIKADGALKLEKLQLRIEAGEKTSHAERSNQHHKLLTKSYLVQTLPRQRVPTKSMWKRLFGRSEYSCIAETHAVPSEAGVFATTDSMNALAQKYGGDYDGWEASVEK
jgi:hypothetical protein